MIGLSDVAVRQRGSAADPGIFRWGLCGRSMLPHAEIAQAKGQAPAKCFGVFLLVSPFCGGAVRKARTSSAERMPLIGSLGCWLATSSCVRSRNQARPPPQSGLNDRAGRVSSGAMFWPATKKTGCALLASRRSRPFSGTDTNGQDGKQRVGRERSPGRRS